MEDKADDKVEDDTRLKKEIGVKYDEIFSQAKQGGYFLNPDIEFVDQLIEGLIVNRERYGYEACPCRLIIGPKEVNMDIICPCYYRDDDVSEYGCCYCGLYVSEDVAKGEKPVIPIPERREPRSVEAGAGAKPGALSPFSGAPAESGLTFPVYRCNVCGYLCARNTPPDKCPICGADQKRFDLFAR